MGDPLEAIADAVQVKTDLQQLRADISALTAVVQSNLAEQQRLNSRLDRSVEQLSKGLQNTRERLVAVENSVCELPAIKENLNTLRANVARYVGYGAGAAIVISTLITVGVKFWG